MVAADSELMVETTPKFWPLKTILNPFVGSAPGRAPERVSGPLWLAVGNVPPKDMPSVTITPSSADSKGVAVIEKSNGGFKVKELNGGTGNYRFDYLVMCKRKVHEDFQVVREKPQLMADENQKILQQLFIF